MNESLLIYLQPSEGSERSPDERTVGGETTNLPDSLNAWVSQFLPYWRTNRELGIGLRLGIGKHEPRAINESLRGQSGCRMTELS
jgi:hypothetical protein